MKLALVQTLAADMGDYAETPRYLAEITRRACETDADLILLPECAFPAYFIGLLDDRGWVEKIDALLSEMSELARKYSKYIAFGLALPEDGKLYNAAVVFDRKGKCVCTARKSNLWHFDYKWFERGGVADVFETEFGRVGVMICADGRVPEIARILRLRGARLILDPVNLVASAACPEELQNQQYGFILQTRAAENGVHIAVCNKAGVESGCVTYLGRSFVASPDGRRIVEASPSGEEILLCDVDLSVGQSLPERRPELYRELCRPTAATNAYRELCRSHSAEELEWFTAVARFSRRDKANYMEKASRYIRRCELQDAKLIVLPPIGRGMGMTVSDAKELAKNLAADTVVAVPLICGEAAGTAVFITHDGLLGELMQTHGCRTRNASEIETLRLAPGLTVAAMFDGEAEIPEIARVAMLKGADLLLWFDTRGNPGYLNLMRTRAAENRCFVLRCVPDGLSECAAIANPDGNIICSTFKDGDQAVAGMVYTAMSRAKQVIPGTNIITGRSPEFYKEIAE